MKNADPSLDRLLRAASQYRPGVAGEPPFGFTTRVVANWLAGTGLERIGLDAKLQAMWFRRAALCALAVMTITVGWSFKAVTDTAPNDEMAIAGYDATADLP
jgi:hypothetical protein